MVDVWDVLRSRLDYASFVPTPLPDIERADLSRRGGGRYTVLKNPHGDGGAGRYARLEPADVALYELMDGRRSVQEILVENLERSGTFALERLARLTSALRVNGFFGEEPPPIYEKLGAIRARRDPLTRLSLLLRRLIVWDIARWTNADRAVDRVYRLIGWLAFTRVGATILVGFGLLGLVLWFEQTRSPIHQLVTLNGSYVLGLILLPLLELDGYHVLVDALDAPFLRQRALAFVRGQAVNKLRRRARWSREEVGLAIFGTVAIFISLATLALSLLIWQTRIGIAARELLALGPVGVLILALIALVFVGPLAIALVARGVAAVRTATRLAASRRARAAQRELGARIALLARVRFLAGLQRPALAALASHLKVESYSEGQIVFAEGSAGDRFYLVRSGRLRAIAPDGTEFGTIIPGEGFGELALLDQTVRSATIQAIEPVELWSLGRGHFNRWVKDRYEVVARIRASRGERDALATLPFFKGLNGQELERIAARLQTQRFGDGDAVFFAGEPGDRYYIIREGKALVTLADGRPARTLGPGDGFGDLALLFGRPRSATVTAVGPLVVAALERNDFLAMVRAPGETEREFRVRTGHYVGAGLGEAVAGA